MNNIEDRECTKSRDQQTWKHFEFGKISLWHMDIRPEEILIVIVFTFVIQ